MNATRLLPRIATLGLLLAFAACSTPGPTPTGLPVPKLVPSTATFAEQLPTGAVIATLHPQRLSEAEPLLRKLLPEEALEGRTAFEAIEQEIFGGEVATKGLDRNRAIVIGLADPDHYDSFADTTFGIAPQDVDFTVALHVVALVPATDAAELERSVAGWVQLTGAEALSAPNASGRPAFRHGDGTLFLLRRGDDHVRFDLFAFGDPGLGDEAALSGALAALEREEASRSRRPHTPALNHLLSAEGVVGVYIDRSRLLGLSVSQGLGQGMQALPSADPAFHGQLLGRIWSILLGTAVFMAPSERLVHDGAYTLHLGQVVELHAVETLTERGSKAYAAARKASGPIFGVAPQKGEPLLSLQVGMSLKTLLEQGGVPRWTTGEADEAMERIDEGGAFNLIYLLTGSISRTVAALGQAVLRLPDSASLIVMPHPEVEGEVRGGLIALTDGDGALFDDEFSRDFIGPVEEGMAAYSRSQVGERTRHDLVFGGALSDVFAATPSEPEANLEGRGRVADLLDELGLGDAEVLAILFHDVTFRTSSRDHTLASVLRLSRADDGAAKAPDSPAPDTAQMPSPTPLLIGGERAPAVRDDEGAVCLESYAAQAAQLFEAVANVAPDTRGMLVGQATDAMAADLACARKDSSLAPVADRAESSTLYLLASIFDMLDDDGPGALVWADRACALKHEAACALAARLRPAWPEGTLTLPVTVLPTVHRDRQGRGDVGVAVGQKGIYVNRRALDTRDASSAAVATAVKAELDQTDGVRRLRLSLDEGADFATLIALLQLAEEFDVYATLLVQTPTGQVGALPAGLERSQREARRANPQPVWLNVQPTQILMQWYAASGKLQSSTIPLGQDPGLAVARSLQAAFPAPLTYLDIRLHAHDALPLEVLTAIVGGVYSPRGLDLGSVTTLEQAMEQLETRSHEIARGQAPALSFSAAPFSLGPKK